jgi:hypothetical protein
MFADGDHTATDRAPRANPGLWNLGRVHAKHRSALTARNVHQRGIPPCTPLHRILRNRPSSRRILPAIDDKH